MSKPIEDRENKMQVRALTLFNNMTDEDFIYVHEAGQLNRLCMALSLDLNSKPYSNEAEC